MTTADERPPSVADFAYNDFYGAMVEREHLQVSRDEATWSVQDVVVPEVGTEFKSNGLARFLIERIDELGQDVPWRQGVPIRAAIHGHLGEHPVRDAHPSLVMQLLERVPGVDLVGYADTPALAFGPQVLRPQLRGERSRLPVQWGVHAHGRRLARSPPGQPDCGEVDGESRLEGLTP
jgi:hypothetical protein